MKMHKLEVYVIDHEGFGIDEYIHQIASARGMSAQVKASQTAEIGEWIDDHALNQATTTVETFRAYFDAQGATK